MPDISYQAQVSPQGLPGRAFPHLPQEAPEAAFGTGIGRGIEFASGEVQQHVNAAMHQARQAQLTDAHNQLQALSLGLARDPQTGALAQSGKNAFGLSSRYLPAFDAQAGSIVAAVPDPLARQAAGLAAAQVRTHLEEELNTHELEQHRQFGLTTAQASIALAQQVAGANANHPDIIAAQRDHIAASVDSLAQMQGWGKDSPQYAEALARATDGLHGQVVRSLVSGGRFDLAQTYLNAHVGEMAPETSESAQRLIYSTEEHQLVLQERMEKLASDHLSREAQSLAFAHKLTPAWLEAHKDALEPAELRQLYGTLAGEDESATDPRVYADLVLRAAEGQDVRDDARRALIDTHTLSRADFSRIVGSVGQSRPGWYKRGTQFLSEALDPGQLNPDPAAHQSKAYALDDWQQWASEHKDATDAEARRAYSDLAHHYQIVPDQKAALLMRAPRFLVGTRTNPVDEQGRPDPQMNATSRRLVGAFRAGQISREDFNHEALLIEQYRRIAAAQAAARAKQEAQK